MLDDPALADRLFRRAQPYLPQRVDARELVGFNERFRFYRYRSGQMFKAHFDGAFHRFGRREESLLTFMVYLNDDFTGGSTNFIFDLNLPPELGGQLRVRPVRGTALVFVHRQLHEGAPVEDGQKYVLRTDVMYGAPAKSAGGRADS